MPDSVAAARDERHPGDGLQTPKHRRTAVSMGYGSAAWPAPLRNGWTVPPAPDTDYGMVVNAEASAALMRSAACTNSNAASAGEGRSRRASAVRR